MLCRWQAAFPTITVSGTVSGEHSGAAAASISEALHHDRHVGKEQYGKIARCREA